MGFENYHYLLVDGDSCDKAGIYVETATSSKPFFFGISKILRLRFCSGLVAV